MINLFDSQNLECPVLEEVLMDVKHGYSDHVELPRKEKATCLQILTQSRVFAAPGLRAVTIGDSWGDVFSAKSYASIPMYEAVTSLVFTGCIFWDTEGSDDEDQAGEEDEDPEHFDGLEALDLLESFPNLTSVVLRIADCNAFEALETPVTLPHLTSMTIDSKTIPRGFGPSLDLPRLETLHLNLDLQVSSSQMTGSDEDNGIGEFLLQHARKLKHLSFHRLSVTQPELLGVIARLTNVKSLKLSGTQSIWFTYDTTDTLLLSELSRPDVCPHLEEIELSDISNIKPEGSTERAFTEFLVNKGGTLPKGDKEEGDASESVPRSLRSVTAIFKYETKFDIPGELKTRGIVIEATDISVAHGCPHIDASYMQEVDGEPM
ncbi:hypothetical protein NMY22_g10296 [Coprinellus aureogranulatus]|nr:hypothetical protein NMY22_g10296 [Coprinellus aureogranulatus]